MTLEALGQDPLEMLVEQALRRLSEGEPPSRIEVERVDVKEDRDRGAPHGATPPTPPGIRVRTTAVRSD